jgi:hypothetical protein
MRLALAFVAALALVACSSDDPAPAPAAKVCTPGATQPCNGPGACVGAQACNGDGSAFGACECGGGQGGAAGAGGGGEAGAGGAGAAGAGGSSGAGGAACIPNGMKCSDNENGCCPGFHCETSVNACLAN